MTSINTTELLNDKDILEEINRFKWIESEKAGCDIGFERASKEWINSYSDKFLARHPNKTMTLWLKSQTLVKFLYKKMS